MAGGSPPLGTHSPRAVSPFGHPPAVPPKALSNGRGGDREPQVLKKKSPSNNSAVAAVGILKALDPHPETPRLYIGHSDEFLVDPNFRDEKKERKGFWERASERSREKEREREKVKERERRDEEGQAELTRMIGPSSRHYGIHCHARPVILILILNSHLCRISHCKGVRRLVLSA